MLFNQLAIGTKFYIKGYGSAGLKIKTAHDSYSDARMRKDAPFLEPFNDAFEVIVEPLGEPEPPVDPAFDVLISAAENLILEAIHFRNAGVGEQSLNIAIGRVRGAIINIKLT